VIYRTLVHGVTQAEIWLLVRVSPALSRRISGMPFATRMTGAAQLKNSAFTFCAQRTELKEQ